MAVLTSAIGYLCVLANLTGILVSVTIGYLIGNYRLTDPMVKFFCRAVPFSFGCLIRVRGRSRMLRERPCIYMANHVNVFDPLVLYGSIPVFVRAVELEDHFRWPLWGLILKRAQMIPISHRHVGQAMKSLERAKAALAAGTSIIILPEGHRTRDGNLGAFMRGPFRLAQAAGVDIVPIALRGAFERKSVHSLLVRPGRQDLMVGTAIPGSEVTEMDERALRDRVHAEIAALME